MHSFLPSATTPYTHRSLQLGASDGFRGEKHLLELIFEGNFELKTRKLNFDEKTSQKTRKIDLKTIFRLKIESYLEK